MMHRAHDTSKWLQGRCNGNIGLLGQNLVELRLRGPNCRGRFVHYALMNATTTGYMSSFPTLQSSVSVICKAYLWGPQQLPGLGRTGGMEWPGARLAMIILELLRRTFSCAGCNSNQVEASWRGTLFLLLHTVRPLRNAAQLANCGVA
jgi:hypothetical protein